MTYNAYRAYGLSIHAEFACLEMPAHPNPAQDADVTIRLLTDGQCTLGPLPDHHFAVSPGKFRLDVPGVARYSVEEGKRISIEPLPGSSPDKVRLFLLGSTMGALLYQRGLFPLHGSAVETKWGAMIFVGAQGSGKSTLAAEFHRMGYRLLSDDVCAIEPTSDGFQVLPALAHMRLRADAFNRVGSPVGARFDVDKFVVPLGDRYCPEATPLRAIHVLSNHGEGIPRIEILRGLDRVQYLLENLYRPHYLKGQQTQSELMRMAGKIAQHATLAAVSRRRDQTETGDLVKFLESAWTECFSGTLCEKRD